jgi:hypothetical protein
MNKFGFSRIPPEEVSYESAIVVIWWSGRNAVWCNSDWPLCVAAGSSS